MTKLGGDAQRDPRIQPWQSPSMRSRTLALVPAGALEQEQLLRLHVGQGRVDQTGAPALALFSSGASVHAPDDPGAIAAGRGAVRVRLLGEFRLESGGAEVESELLRRSHVRGLLALLVATPERSIDRSAACAALWPSFDEARALNRLYHTVLLLKRLLNDCAGAGWWVEVRQGVIVLARDVTSDSIELITAGGDDTDPESAADIAARWDRLPVLASWMEGEAIELRRERVRSAWRQLLQKVVRQFHKEGETVRRRRILEICLEEMPFDEEAYRQLMQLELQAGRPVAALAVFERGERTMREGLGLQPSPILRGVAVNALALLEQGASAISSDAETSTRTALPIIGREDLLAELAKSLIEDEAHVLTLVGPGGVGKSRLAREILRRHAAAFSDGVFWVDAGSVSGVGRLPQQLLKTMGVVESAAISPLEQLREILRESKLLLVIDSAESLGDLSPLLDALEPTMAWSSHLIVTTRIAEAHCRAKLVEVPCLAVPDAEAKYETSAVQLFLSRAGSIGAQTTTQHLLSDISRLVRRLDGLPLAIELAAARSDTHTPAEIEVELAENLDVLAGGPLDLAERHRSMTAVLQWTFGLLSPGARLGFVAAGTFAESFSTTDLEYIASVTAMSFDVSSVLDELCRFRLVRRDVQIMPDEARFRMLELPRLYARRLASRDGQRASLQSAHLQWAQKIAETASIESDRVVSEAAARIDLVLTDIRMAIDHAFDAAPEVAAGFVSSLIWYWHLRGHLDEGIAFCERARKLEADLLPLPLRSKLMTGIAAMMTSQSRFEDAMKVAEVACALSAELPERGYSLAAHDIWLNLSMATSRGLQALERCRVLLAQSAAYEHEASYWRLTFRVRIAARTLGNTSGDLGGRRDLLALRGSLGGTPLWMLVLVSEWGDRVAAEEYADAIAVADEGVRLASALQSAHWVAEFLGRRAYAELGQGQRDAFWISIRAARQVADRLRLRAQEAGYALHEAYVAALEGDLQYAANCLSACDSVIRTLGYPASRVAFHCISGMVAERNSRLDEALSQYAALLRDSDCFAQLQDAATLLRVAHFGVRVMRGFGDVDLARELLALSLAIQSRGRLLPFERNELVNDAIALGLAFDASGSQQPDDVDRAARAALIKALTGSLTRRGRDR